MASILNAQEMTYLVKTAKAVGLSVIVVVASKTQLLDVLHNVTGVSMIAITSRNHFLWKIDLSKADRILADSEVKDAIREWKSKSENNLLIQEGFASPEDLAMTRTSGAVDAVLVGEEVLSRCEDFNEEGYALSLKAWIGNQI